MLAVGSLASRGGEFVALAELLASHSLVVAEVLPPAGVSTTAFDDRAVTTSVERLGRARATLAADDGIDPARLAVLTWSFGGVPGTVAACESLPALAIVSLDSALGYRYCVDLLRSRGIDMTTCAAGLLSVRAGVGNPVPTDHTFMDRWAPGRVVRIAAAGMAMATSRIATARSRRGFVQPPTPPVSGNGSAPSPTRSWPISSPLCVRISTLRPTHHLVTLAFAMLAIACRPPSMATEGPGVRNGHGLAFDGQVTLPFGGADERQVLDDTWAWDGRRWRVFAAPGPAPRTFPVMASADPGTV